MTVTETDCPVCATTGWVCERHQIPPVCVCDEPEQGPGCERCDYRHCIGTCHGCHRPVGEQFTKVRAAWREYLEAS